MEKLPQSQNPKEPEKEILSRRSFLRRGVDVAAASVAVSAIPGLALANNSAEIEPDFETENVPEKLRYLATSVNRTVAQNGGVPEYLSPKKYPAEKIQTVEIINKVIIILDEIKKDPERIDGRTIELINKLITGINNDDNQLLQVSLHDFATHTVSIGGYLFNTHHEGPVFIKITGSEVIKPATKPALIELFGADLSATPSFPIVTIDDKEVDALGGHTPYGPVFINTATFAKGTLALGAEVSREDLIDIISLNEAVHAILHDVYGFSASGNGDWGDFAEDNHLPVPEMTDAHIHEFLSDVASTSEHSEMIFALTWDKLREEIRNQLDPEKTMSKENGYYFKTHYVGGLIEERLGENIFEQIVQELREQNFDITDSDALLQVLKTEQGRIRKIFNQEDLDWIRNEMMRVGKLMMVEIKKRRQVKP
ncbi:MAG: hypothetical protein ACI9VM_000204 [Candidatus Azotimanducaceae bacterium]|jgi:hypothetical protein